MMPRCGSAGKVTSVICSFIALGGPLVVSPAGIEPPIHLKPFPALQIFNFPHSQHITHKPEILSLTDGTDDPTLTVGNSWWSCCEAVRANQILFVEGLGLDQLCFRDGFSCLTLTDGPDGADRSEGGAPQTCTGEFTGLLLMT